MKELNEFSVVEPHEPTYDNINTPAMHVGGYSAAKAIPPRYEESKIEVAETQQKKASRTYGKRTSKKFQIMLA